MKDATTITWEQTWTGVVLGGTGRFAGATGTFTKILSGQGTGTGFMSIYEGTIEVQLDPE
jgi:hypothetical protein